MTQADLKPVDVRPMEPLPPPPPEPPPPENLVDAVLERFFAGSRQRAGLLSPAYERLWQVLERNAAGGKRFRPRLVLAAYHGLGGRDLQAAAQVGAAFELLHTALVVHDDVIDRDFSRRNGPNIAGTYRQDAAAAGLSRRDAEHHGMSAAIIAGDLALFNSYRLLGRAHADPVIGGRLQDIFDGALFASAGGELLDIDYAVGPGPIGVDQVIAMEHAKTAVYSFEAPLQAGAVLAGAPEETVGLLGGIGRDIGIAYQIVDDLLGVFGDPASTGKTAVGDLLEGKRTILMAHAFGRPEGGDIAALLGRDGLTDAEAERIRSLLISAGTRSFARDLAGDFADRALARLQDSALPHLLGAELRRIIGSVLNRSR